MDDIITLLAAEKGADELGDPDVTTQGRDVFCGVKSVGMKEFYEADAVGLKPEIVFVFSDYLDYGGETHLTYNEEVYRVLRTYRTGLRLELVCYREVNPPEAPA